MKKNQLLDLLNDDFPCVRDTRNGKVYGLRGLITMQIPGGRSVEGMMLGNRKGEQCRSLDDFADFVPA